jgi:hypothetical protein
MTTQLESQRQTAEWFEALKPSVKDMVCRTYHYIMLHKDNPDNPTALTDEGIAWAVRSTSITGVSDKHIQRYIDNIDHIKNLYDNRPSKNIVYWNDVEERLDLGVNAHCEFKHYTIFGYDDQKVNDRIQHERNDWGHLQTSKWGTVSVRRYKNLKEI